jgi:hypothetical protein
MTGECQEHIVESGTTKGDIANFDTSRVEFAKGTGQDGGSS